MTDGVDAYLSLALSHAHYGMRFSTVTAGRISQRDLESMLASQKERDAGLLVERRDQVERRVALGSSFFAEAEHIFPLARQLDNVLAHGFGQLPPLVLALERCELLSGVLMGVQDADAIRGPVVLDRVDEDSESFEGMRGMVRCAPGEVVVRDEGGIVASVFQGPDRRTQVTKRTTNAVFYVFDVPELGSGFEEAETLTVELLNACACYVHVNRAASPAQL